MYPDPDPDPDPGRMRQREQARTADRNFPLSSPHVAPSLLSVFHCSRSSNMISGNLDGTFGPLAAVKINSEPVTAIEIQFSLLDLDESPKEIRYAVCSY